MILCERDRKQCFGESHLAPILRLRLQVLSVVDLKHLSQPFHVSPENPSFSGILMVLQMFTFHLYGTVAHTGVVGSTREEWKNASSVL